MKATLVRLNGTYKMKPEIFNHTVQANGRRHESPYVTVVRVQYPAGRKRAWYYDARGNAYRSDDFQCAIERLQVEI